MDAIRLIKSKRKRRGIVFWGLRSAGESKGNSGLITDILNKKSLNTGFKILSCDPADPGGLMEALVFT